MPTTRFSDAVLDAAICKAVEAGVFPRRSTVLEAAMNREIMSAILEAAYVAATEEDPDSEPVSVHNRVRAAAGRTPPRMADSLHAMAKVSEP